MLELNKSINNYIIKLAEKSQKYNQGDKNQSLLNDIEKYKRNLKLIFEDIENAKK